MKVGKFNTALAMTGQGANLLADPVCDAWPYVNANEFIFLPDVLKKSYQTMENMPFNFMHDEKNILGHVSKAWTGEKQIDVAGKPAQCVSMASTVVFYDHIFPELFDKISRGQTDDRFKVSVEAGFKDFKWALYDKNSQDRTMESVPEGVNEDLDFLGFWGLLFGTFAGIEYGGKQMACLMAPDSHEVKFVGLALTDELNGAAADQNTDLTVLGSPKFLTCSGKNGFSAVKINKMMASVVGGKSVDDVAKENDYDANSIREMIEYASNQSNREKVELTSKNFDFAKFSGKQPNTAIGMQDPAKPSVNASGISGLDIPTYAVAIGRDGHSGLFIDYGEDGIVLRSEKCGKVNLSSMAKKLDELVARVEAGEKLSIAYDQIDMLETKCADQAAKIIELTKCVDTSSVMVETLKSELESAKMSIESNEKLTVASLAKAAEDHNASLESVKDELGKLRMMELVDLGLGQIAASSADSLRELSSADYSAKKEEWKRLAGVASDASKSGVVLLDSDDPKFFEKLVKKASK